MGEFSHLPFGIWPAGIVTRPKTIFICHLKREKVILKHIQGYILIGHLTSYCVEVGVDCRINEVKLISSICYKVNNLIHKPKGAVSINKCPVQTEGEQYVVCWVGLGKILQALNEIIGKCLIRC